MGPAIASAQLAPVPSPTLPERKPFAQLRFGALTITPVLRVTEIGLDTNVFNLAESSKRSPDFTATIRPQLETRWKTSALDAFVTGGTDLVYYRQFSSERSISPTVQAGADYRMGKLTVFGRGGGGTSRERPGHELDIRLRVQSLGVSVGARLEGRHVALESQASRGKTEYEKGVSFQDVPLDELLNRDNQSIGTRLLVRFSPYTTFGFGGEATRIRFPLAPNRDLDSTEAQISLALHPRALITGNVQVGYKVAKTLNDLSPDFSGITAGGGVSTSLFDRLSIWAGVERDIDHSYRLDFPYFVYLIYEAALRQALPGRLDIGVGLSQTTLSYRRFENGPSAAGGSDDVIRNESASIGIRVTRQQRVAFYASRWRRLSDNSPYEGLRTGVMVTLGRANLNERGVFLNGPMR